MITNTLRRGNAKEGIRRRAAHAVAIITSYPGTGIQTSLSILMVLRLMKTVGATIGMVGSRPHARWRLE
eukprot:4154332-Pyramimonas_sp.AAC.1